MTDLAIMEYNATQRAEKKAEARMRKMAKDFKEEGTSLDVIARCTGLSVEEIKAL